jgi:hypothetical protein
MDNLTVLMPVKNGATFLENSLTVILGSIAARDEILVVDDNSTDNSLEILKRFRRENPSISILQNNGLGISSALNLGLKEASHSFVARYDVDDVYLSDRLDIQRRLFDRDVVAIFSDYEIWGDGLKYLGTIVSSIYPEAMPLSLISGQRTAHPSVVMIREEAILAGGYREQDFPAEDLSLWLRMSRLGHLVSVPEPLLHYRLSGGSTTMQNRSFSQQQKRKLITEIGLSKSSIQWGLEEALSVLQKYNDTKNGEARKILFLRDLMLLESLGIISKKDLASSTIPGLLSINLRNGALAVYKELKYSKQREKFRGNLN